MRISIRYDDNQTPGPNASRPPDLCNVDLYINFQEDLVKAQAIISALMQILPPEKEPG